MSKATLAKAQESFLMELAAFKDDVQEKINAQEEKDNPNEDKLDELNVLMESIESVENACEELSGSIGG